MFREKFTTITGWAVGTPVLIYVLTVRVVVSVRLLNDPFLGMFLRVYELNYAHFTLQVTGVRRSVQLVELVL